jgi:hypothetical protein
MHLVTFCEDDILQFLPESLLVTQIATIFSHSETIMYAESYNLFDNITNSGAAFTAPSPRFRHTWTCPGWLSSPEELIYVTTGFKCNEKKRICGQNVSV